MDKDDTFVQVGNPVARILAQLEGKRLIKAADELREAARATNNQTLIKQSAEQLVEFERFAGESQWWA